jgi:hypothetical protein
MCTYVRVQWGYSSAVLSDASAYVLCDFKTVEYVSSSNSQRNTVSTVPIINGILSTEQPQFDIRS